MINFTWNLLITLFITRFFEELEQIYVGKIIGLGNAKTEFNKLNYDNTLGYSEDPYLPMADLVNVIQVSSKLNDKIVLAMSHPTSFVITSHSLVSVYIFNYINYWFYIHLFHLAAILKHHHVAFHWKMCIFTQLASTSKISTKSLKIIQFSQP